MKTSTFEQLSQINCNDHVQTKGKFSYLSWTWAWSILKKHVPDATFEKHLFNGLPYMVDANGYAFVSVSVTAEGDTLTEVYAVLDNRNQPIKNPTSFQINTSLQRCLVKAIAFTGLGLYIYAGEDLPDNEEPPAVLKTEVITADQVATLTQMIDDSSTDAVAFCNFLKITDIQTMPPAAYDTAVHALTSKLKKQRQA